MARATKGKKMLDRRHLVTGLVVGLLATGFLALWSPPRRAPMDAARAPNTWSFTERAFPYDHIPLDVWRTAQAQAAADRVEERFAAAVWTQRGPDNIGGRITDVAVDPSNDDIVFVGAAEGGVFRTLDGGQSWTPLFDEMPALSIGALAIQPSNSNVIYAGTGEVNPGGGSIAYGGVGLFRSDDQGESWTLIGLENSGSIGRIVVHPTDPLTILVAANGMQWQANPERGVYRTTDGGDNWSRVLYVDEQTGCVDLVLRPDNPDVVFASMWQHIRQPEYYDYGGPGCAVHVSTDGGDNWSVVAGGLPAPSDVGGRIGLSLCAGQPDVMHAIYADRVGYFTGLYRSEDGGTTWGRTTDAALADVFASYGWWFGNVRTHPKNPAIIYVLGLEFWMSTDAGQSYFDASDGMHVDHHGLDFGPGTNPVIYNGNDGGVYRSTDGGTVWTKLPDQPLTQVYRMALCQQNPGAIYIGAQDNGTCRTFTPAVDDWESIFGGDGMQTLIHPRNANKIWAQYQYGSIVVSTNGGSAWLLATLGITGSDRKNWNAPLIQDPHDPEQRYTGTHRVYRSTTDRNWTPISEDLTGGPHQGNPGQVDGSLTTLAVSPLDGSVLWAGSNDGYVHVSTNGGGSWTDVSASLPVRWITAVRADPLVRETAYVTISGFRWTEALPHVFRTTDLGVSWTPIAGNLPEAPVNDLVADPLNTGHLFVATDVGVYESQDGGLSWTMLGTGLPNALTTSLALDSSRQELLVGTFGRSVFSIPIEVDLIFADGFETGDSSRWGNSVP